MTRPCDGDAKPQQDCQTPQYTHTLYWWHKISLVAAALGLTFSWSLTPAQS
jgi:hypothetical protein